MAALTSFHAVKCSAATYRPSDWKWNLCKLLREYAASPPYSSWSIVHSFTALLL